MPSRRTDQPVRESLATVLERFVIAQTCMRTLLADVAERVSFRWHWILIRASIGKQSKTAARDNWHQRQELAKGGERTQTAANESTRIPASQPIAPQHSKFFY